ERGRGPADPDAGGRAGRRPHPGRARRRPARPLRRATYAGRDHALRVARARGGGPGDGPLPRSRGARTRRGGPGRARREARMKALEPIPLAEIRAARERIAGSIVRTPLMRLELPLHGFEGAQAELYLKLENLQPIGSFKLRGASNAMAC